MPHVRKLWHLGSKEFSIRNCKYTLLQKNLQLCYSAILNVELHCSSIVKTKILFYSFSLSSCLLTLPLSQLYLLRLSLSFRFLPLPLLSLNDFSLSLYSPSGHHWPPSPSNAKPRPHLNVLLQCGFDVLLRWVCSEVGVVCSDGGACCLLRWVWCGFDGFAPMWVWFAPIMMHVVCSDGSWIRWQVWIGGSMYHGSDGGVGLDQLWPVGLDHGDWWVSRWRLVGFWVWIDVVCVDWCCGFGLVLLWPVL